MTVQIQETVFSHTGNGVSTTFAYGCLVLLQTDLQVRIDGTVQEAGFTVTDVGNAAGGTVIFDTAPANGVAVVLQRLLPLERATDYQQHGDWEAAVINPDFDRLVMIDQQQQEQIERGLHYPVGDSANSAEIPSVADRADKLLGFDEAGNPKIFTTDAENVIAAQEAADDAESAAAQALAALAVAGLPASLIGKALNYLRVKSDATGYEFRTATQTRSDLGLAAVASSGSAADLSTGTLPAARLPAATTAVVGGVQLATDTEARALSDTSKPITPGTLKTALTGSNQSLGTNGYQKLPGGLILQWGTIVGASGSATQTFPTAFPTACVNVQLSNNTSGNTPVWLSKSTTGFGYTAPSTMNIDWFAIGY